MVDSPEQLPPAQHPGFTGDISGIFESRSGPTKLNRDGTFTHEHKDARGLRWLVSGALGQITQGEPLVIAHLMVSAVDSPRGVDSTALQVPVGQILTTLSRLVAQRDKDVRKAYAAMHGGKAASWPKHDAPDVRSTRRGRSPARRQQLRDLAASYLALQDEPGSLYRALAERHHIAESTVADQVRAATEDGWLSAAIGTKKGRTAGPAWKEGTNQ